MLKTRSLNTSQAAKGDNGNRHRNSLGERDPTAFMYTQTHTLQRCPWHLRIFSKNSPSANEDHFQPPEFILSSKGRRKCSESFLFLSVPTLRAKAGQSSPFTKPWQTLFRVLTPVSPSLHASVGPPTQLCRGLFLPPHLPPLCHPAQAAPHQYTELQLSPRLSSYKEDVKCSAEEARGRKTREDIAKTTRNSGCRL